MVPVALQPSSFLFFSLSLPLRSHGAERASQRPSSLPGPVRACLPPLASPLTSQTTFPCASRPPSLLSQYAFGRQGHAPRREAARAVGPHHGRCCHGLAQRCASCQLSSSRGQDGAEEGGRSASGCVNQYKASCTCKATSCAALARVDPIPCPGSLTAGEALSPNGSERDEDMAPYGLSVCPSYLAISPSVSL